MIQKKSSSLICPYCNSGETFKYFSLENNTVRRCVACDLIFKEIQGSEEELLSYYKNHYYDDWESKGNDSDRKDIYINALKHIEKYVEKGKLLDIGSGIGTLPAMARIRGWQEVTGQEISIGSCQAAEKIHGVSLINCPLSEMEWKPDHYDAITLINVLDHLQDPWWVVQKSSRSLKDTGILYIRLPNGYTHSLFYRLSDSIPVRSIRTKIRKFLVLHLFHFTPSFLIRMFKDMGLRIISINQAPVTASNTYPSFRHADAILFSVVKKIFPMFAKFINLTFRRKLLISSSIEVLASRTPTLHNSQ
jgi:2-polyprenyl-3-methyl-5-hydroxy-6-metoxy-1,4-benzoquinol methylase